MAKRTYYSFEKRQKEIRKQEKKEAKAEARRLRKEEKRAATETDQDPGGADSPVAVSEEEEGEPDDEPRQS